MAVRFSASPAPKSRRRNASIIAFSAMAAVAALVAAPGLATASPPSRSATESANTTALAPQFHTAIAQHSNKCLDVSGASLADGAQVIQWPCHGGANQDFILVPTGLGWNFVIARHSGQCLDVRGASMANGAPVIQWPCHGGANQQWRRLNFGIVSVLVARHSNKCLFVLGASLGNGAQVVQWPCLFTLAAQRWRIS